MRKPLKVEKTTAKDWPQMAEWMGLLSHRNNIDTEIFSYPATKTFKAGNGNPLLYMPIQNTVMLESLAFNPEATNAEKATALREMFSVVSWEARNAGIGEIYFLCADQETKTFVEHHGFEAMTACTEEKSLQLYRLKL